MKKKFKENKNFNSETKLQFIKKLQFGGKNFNLQKKIQFKAKNFNSNSKHCHFYPNIKSLDNFFQLDQFNQSNNKFHF